MRELRVGEYEDRKRVRRVRRDRVWGERETKRWRQTVCERGGWEIGRSGRVRRV